MDTISRSGNLFEKYGGESSLYSSSLHHDNDITRSQRTSMVDKEVRRQLQLACSIAMCNVATYAFRKSVT